MLSMIADIDKNLCFSIKKHKKEQVTFLQTFFKLNLNLLSKSSDLNEITLIMFVTLKI